MPGYATLAWRERVQRAFFKPEHAPCACEWPIPEGSGQIHGLFGGFVKVHVEFQPRRQEDRPVELPEGATAGDVVAAVGESTDIIVVVRGNTPIPEDDLVVDGEKLLLLSAASGG